MAEEKSPFPTDADADTFHDSEPAADKGDGTGAEQPVFPADAEKPVAGKDIPNDGTGAEGGAFPEDAPGPKD